MRIQLPVKNSRYITNKNAAKNGGLHETKSS